MYRVVTKYLDRHRNWVVERGPWHPTAHDAENWADLLRAAGYNAEVEGQHGVVAEQHPDSQALKNALASMA